MFKISCEKGCQTPASFAYHKERYNMWDIDLSFLQESAQIFLDEFV